MCSQETENITSTTSSDRTGDRRRDSCVFLTGNAPLNSTPSASLKCSVDGDPLIIVGAPFIRAADEWGSKFRRHLKDSGVCAQKPQSRPAHFFTASCSSRLSKILGTRTKEVAFGRNRKPSGISTTFQTLTTGIGSSRFHRATSHESRSRLCP